MIYLVQLHQIIAMYNQANIKHIIPTNQARDLATVDVFFCHDKQKSTGRRNDASGGLLTFVVFEHSYIFFIATRACRGRKALKVAYAH